MKKSLVVIGLCFVVVLGVASLAAAQSSCYSGNLQAVLWPGEDGTTIKTMYAELCIDFADSGSDLLSGNIVLYETDMIHSYYFTGFGGSTSKYQMAAPGLLMTGEITNQPIKGLPRPISHKAISLKGHCPGFSGTEMDSMSFEGTLSYNPPGE